jgi:hypothetical protein
MQTQLAALSRVVDLDVLLQGNPMRGNYVVCGAIRGLDIPARALCSLAREFNEQTVYILCRNQERPKANWLLRLRALEDPDNVSRALHSEHAGIFTGDLNVCWGDSGAWLILFSSQLAIGVLVTLTADDRTRAAAAYTTCDQLQTLPKALAECSASDARGLTEHLGYDVSDELARNWNVQLVQDAPSSNGAA